MRLNSFALALSATLLAACSTTAEKVSDDHFATENQAKAINGLVHPKYSSVDVTDRPYYETVEQGTAGSSYLSSIQLSISEPDEPLRGSEIARMFKRKGINVVSSLPLDNYYYNGLGISQTDAETALTAILSPMGLDWREDERARVVEIIPVRSKTWKLTIGPRVTEFDAGGDSQQKQSGQQQQQQQSSSGGGIQGLTNNANESSSTKFTAAEDFWKELSAELDKRLTIKIPRASAAQSNTGAKPAKAAAGQVPSPSPAFAFGGQQQESGNQPQLQFDDIQVGTFAINRSTGAVTVQAPQYLLSTIGDYLDNVDRELNTLIVFEGRIILVSDNSSDTQGIDWSAFKNFAQDYGMIVSNNVLGGLTVSLPGASNFANVTSQGALSGANFGIIQNNNSLAMFTAFMERFGTVRTVTEPHISTTSGVPAVYSQFDRDYVNNISQTSASSTTNTAVAVQNNFLPFQFGLSLRVNPRYDAANDTVRTQVALTQVIQSGTRRIEQIVNDTTGSHSLFTDIPLDRRVDLHGEMLIPDGALVVFGGQKVTDSSRDQQGLTGTTNTPLFPFFGNKANKSQESTYYVALTVHVVDSRKSARMGS